MTETAEELTTPSRMANELKDVENFDPAVGAYDFSNLGEAIRFAGLMAKAGPMVPEIFREQPGVCLAVTMRAIQWKFDPFALAAEVYQAKQGGPIGYQAKVFVGALLSMTGITLKFRYEGETSFSDKAAKSINGNQTAAQTAGGSRKCTAYAIVDGEELSYTTLEIKDIKPKNSPLWHNDPDQQLAYYAGRAWVRRYRPAVMMGAYSADEVKDMEPMRDVTPKKTGGFVGQLNAARDAAAQTTGENTEEATTVEGEATEEGPTEEAEAAEEGGEHEAAPEQQEDAPEVDLEAAYTAGAEAAVAGSDRAAPEDAGPDATMAWFAGFDEKTVELEEA
jgi:hypothetical protein